MNNNILQTFAELLYILSKSENVEMYDLVRNLKCLISGEVLKDSEPFHFAPKGGANSKRAETFTVEEIAEDLGLHPKTIRKLIQAGHLKVLAGVIPYKITRQSWNEYLQGISLGEDQDFSIANPDNMSADVQRPSRGKSPICLSRTTVKSDMERGKEAQFAVDSLEESERSKLLSSYPA